jgi:hypothetical protein
MVDSLHGRLYFCILADSVTRIEIPVPLLPTIYKPLSRLRLL